MPGSLVWIISWPGTGVQLCTKLLGGDATFPVPLMASRKEVDDLLWGLFPYPYRPQNPITWRLLTRADLSHNSRGEC